MLGPGSLLSISQVMHEAEQRLWPSRGKPPWQGSPQALLSQGCLLPDLQCAQGSRGERLKPPDQPIAQGATDDDLQGPGGRMVTGTETAERVARPPS